MADSGVLFDIDGQDINIDIPKEQNKEISDDENFDPNIIKGTRPSTKVKK